jgi:acyl carrier protein
MESDYELNSDFREDLGCDSLDMMDLTMTIEKEFNIMIPDDDVYSINTVQQLMDYVDKRISVLQEDC